MRNSGPDAAAIEAVPDNPANAMSPAIAVLTKTLVIEVTPQDEKLALFQLSRRFGIGATLWQAA